MSPPAIMLERVTRLEANYSHLERLSDTRHQENQLALKQINRNQEVTNTKIGTINNKIAWFSGASGVITAVAVKIVEHYWK